MDDFGEGLRWELGNFLWEDTKDWKSFELTF